MLLKTAERAAATAEQKLQEAFYKIIKAIYQTNKLKGHLDDITSFNNLDHAINEARLNANSVRNATIAVAEAVREQRVSKAVKESFKATISKSSLKNKVKIVETKAEEVKEAVKNVTGHGLVNDVETEDVTTQDMLQHVENHFLPTPEENPFIDYSVTEEEAETAVAELEAAAADSGDEKKDGGGKKRKSKKVRKSKKSKKTKRRKTKRRKSKKTKRK